MLELEENSKLLDSLSKKIQDLGESLWHSKTRIRIIRFRETDNGRKFLEWQ